MVFPSKNRSLVFRLDHELNVDENHVKLVHNLLHAILGADPGGGGVLGVRTPPFGPQTS